MLQILPLSYPPERVGRSCAFPAELNKVMLHLLVQLLYLQVVTGKRGKGAPHGRESKDSTRHAESTGRLGRTQIWGPISVLLQTTWVTQVNY